MNILRQQQRLGNVLNPNALSEMNQIWIDSRFRRFEISEISSEIFGRRRLLRPKSPDENSSVRSLWKVFRNYFSPPLLLPFPFPSPPLPLPFKKSWAWVGLHSKLLRDYHRCWQADSHTPASGRNDRTKDFFA